MKLKNPLSKKASREKVIREALQKSDIGGFKKEIQRVYDAGGGSVQILKSGSSADTPHNKGSMPISELIGKPDILAAIKEEHGEGFYNLKVDNSQDVTESEHFFQIGPPKKTAKKKKDDEDSDSTIKGKDALVLDMVKGQREQNTVLMNRVLEDKGKDGMSVGEVMQMVVTTMSTSFDRVLEVMKTSQPQAGSGVEMVEVLTHGIDIGMQMQPKIEQPDAMSTLISTLSPLVLQLISMKKGGGAPDSNILQQIQQAITAHQSPGQQRSAAAHPPPPGAPQNAAPRPAATGSPAPVMQDLGATTHQTPIAESQSAELASPAAGSQAYFDMYYRQRFQRDVTAGQPDSELAYQLVKMIEYGRDRMAGDPPPLIADFLTATTVQEADAAFYKFCGALPELANLRQKQEDLKLALITQFEFKEPVINVPNGNHESFGSTEETQGAPEQDTGIDAADDPADSHEDVPGPV